MSIFAFFQVPERLDTTQKNEILNEKPHKFSGQSRTVSLDRNKVFHVQNIFSLDIGKELSCPLDYIEIHIFQK